MTLGSAFKGASGNLLRGPIYARTSSHPAPQPTDPAAPAGMGGGGRGRIPSPPLSRPAPAASPPLALENWSFRAAGPHPRGRHSGLFLPPRPPHREPQRPRGNAAEDALTKPTGEGMAWSERSGPSLLPWTPAGCEGPTTHSTPPFVLTGWRPPDLAVGAQGSPPCGGSPWSPAREDGDLSAP
ncbi:unnamed protein product [Rangifer tarandus platyrhynchus]|uniref:Uncharacterized protein n=1 Tax=Rangifer tarandus platyrhynchus TaxID=3082113 RepID=A0AC59Z9P5_RANTA